MLVVSVYFIKEKWVFRDCRLGFWFRVNYFCRFFLVFREKIDDIFGEDNDEKEVVVVKGRKIVNS